MKNTKNILHDLEEEYDPYYTDLAAVPGPNAETNACDNEEYLDYAKNLGMKVCEVRR